MSTNTPVRSRPGYKRILVEINKDLFNQFEEARMAMPYPPNRTTIIETCIREFIFREQKKMNKKQ